MAEPTAEQLAQAEARAAELQRQLEAERAEREYSQTELEALEQRYAPVRAIADELLSDAELVEIYQQAKKGREVFKQTQQEPPPAWAQPILQKVEKLDNFVEGLTKREKDQLAQQERANAAQAKAWTDSATSYLENLGKDVPGYLTGRKYENGDLELTDDGMMMVNAVSTYARKHQLSFEDAYKRVGDRFKPAGGGKTPPTSLPTDTAETGIPAGERAAPVEGEGVDFAGELERRLAAGRTS